MSPDSESIEVPFKLIICTGIKTIFDLRSTPEIKRDGPEWAGIETDDSDIFEPYGIHRLWNPVFADENYDPESVIIRYRTYTYEGSEGFVTAYKDILQAATSSYGKIFKHLAQTDASPCLINCTAGKDRTGVVIALLLTLAGVPAEKIADEYALTDLGLADLKPMFVERLLKNPALEGNRAGVWRMVSSTTENMLAALEMITKDFGGVENYMKRDCGLTDAEIKQIKTNLLQETN